MALANQAVKPTKRVLDMEGDIDESELFDRPFDEKEEIKDQYENIFDINRRPTRMNGSNFAQGFIGESSANWVDVKTNMDFEVTNDSMLADNIRAENHPDQAQPTISRETLQSLSKLNVSKPIDFSETMKTSRISSMNYRMDADEGADGVLDNDESYMSTIIRSGLAFGLKQTKRGIQHVVKNPDIIFGKA